MLKISELTKEDVGRYVRYTGNPAGKIEIGRIKSWNKKYIFVVYKCNDDWDMFKDYTGIATRPQDLILEKNRGK